MDPGEWVEVPHEQLSPQTLRAVIEAFILREGTNYGAEEVPLETRIEQVRRQLEQGTVVLVFDPQEESCNLLTRQELRRHQKQAPPPGRSHSP